MKFIRSVAIALIGTMLGTTAHSAITYGASNDVGTFYAGVKLGQADVGISHAPDAIAYGVYGGYHYDQNFGAEVEYLTTQDKKFANDSQEYSATALGAYGTYRYHFLETPFYAKGKLGFAKTEVAAATNDGSHSSVKDKIGLGYGIGAGYQNGQLGVEASYSKANDISVLGVGASMTF